jgi:hypothetical protein
LLATFQWSPPKISGARRQAARGQSPLASSARIPSRRSPSRRFLGCLFQALVRKGLLISAGLTMLAAASLPVASVWGTVSGHMLVGLHTLFAMLPIPVTLIFWGLIKNLSSAPDSNQLEAKKTTDD